ncbi:MAG: prephenate dehydrogenase/arogenate dehydrogenase family protein [Aggregatilineales bacterium]
MGTITIGILGLGRLGTSIGLALKRYAASKEGARSGQTFTLTGFDGNDVVAKAAKAKQAVDAIVRSPIAAAENRDIIILTLPYGEMREAYRLIGPALRQGAVVLDFGPLKRPAMDWVAKLPEGAHMVGITPVLNPAYLFDGLDDVDHAAADLFDKGSMLITPGATSDKDAVQLAADFSELLGATPLFADPIEHDGWIAAMEGLPVMLGLAAFVTLSRDEGWSDIRKAGNPSFGRLTHHLRDSHPDDLRDLLLNNRENVIRHLDHLQVTLVELRNLLAENNRAALEQVLIDARDQYSVWLARRRDGRWDESGNAEKGPSQSDVIMSGLMGGYLAGKLRRGKERDDT